MTSFFLALQFLTVIPVKFKHLEQKKAVRSLVFFPLIGLFLGLILCGADKIFFYLNFPQLSIDIILVVILAAITGGMHLDGLSDTFDAFLSGKNRDEMLNIMRDPHVGVMGVLSIISVILLKIAFLYSINPFLKPVALILMCVLSRWSMVLCMLLFPYARSEGKAKTYIQGINPKIFLFSTVIALASVSGLWRIKGIIILVIITALTYLYGSSISKKISGITGDTLGALCELNEIAVLLSILVITKFTI